MSPGASLDTCSVFLLGEYHDDEEIKKINGCFISRFAPPDSLLLVEGEETLAPSPCPLFHLQTKYISSEAVKHILGWDIKNFVLKVLAPKAAHIFATQVHAKQFFARRIDWEQGLRTELREFIDRNDRLPHSELDARWPETKETLSTTVELVAKSLLQFEETEIEPLKRRYSELTSTGELSGETVSVLSDIRKKEREIVRRVMEPHTSTAFCFGKRTEAMIETINKVQSTLGEAKCFLIAGARHLFEVGGISPTHPDESLHLLHEYIQTHPGVVILRPKILDNL